MIFQLIVNFDIPKKADKMCILSVYRKEGNFILTHNRDEHKNRKSSDTICTQFIMGQEVSFPKDLQSNGTWVATSDKWTTAILNGADEYHVHTPPYRHSRGLFPFQLMEFDFIDDYYSNLNLEGIEPFTQIIVDNNNLNLYKLSWNSLKKSFLKIEDEIFIISSSTLYNTSEKSSHKKRFIELNQKNTDNLALLHENLKWRHNVNHPYVKTTSITQVLKNYKEKVMDFKNLSNFELE